MENFNFSRENSKPCVVNSRIFPEHALGTHLSAERSRLFSQFCQKNHRLPEIINYNRL